MNGPQAEPASDLLDMVKLYLLPRAEQFDIDGNLPGLRDRFPVIIQKNCRLRSVHRRNEPIQDLFQHQTPLSFLPMVQNPIIPSVVFVGAYCIRPGGNGNNSKGASIAPLRRT
jgi:hypothetical protein